jgi:hypothetical protein
LNLQTWAPCPFCREFLFIEAFPALVRTEAKTASAAPVMDGEASCFYHSGKKAAQVCDECGRFLCLLCDVDFNGRHLCPNCLETGQKKGKISKLEARRVRHDKIALWLVGLPVLIFPFFYFTLFTAPFVLIYGFRKWRSPGSIHSDATRPGRPSRLMVFAWWLALFETVSWVVVFLAIAYH